MLRVRGVDDLGEVVVDERVVHGGRPENVLRTKGWECRWIRAVSEGQDVVLEFALSQGRSAPAQVQRVAGYAVVLETIEGRPSVLLTSLVGDPTNPWWTLPGGGTDPGEDPQQGVLREVMEETGHHVELGDPLRVDSDHWVGASPRGTVEDFHAVRMVWHARCPAPGIPVVHDVGGSTAEARWVPLDELDHFRVLPWVAEMIAFARQWTL